MDLGPLLESPLWILLGQFGAVPIIAGLCTEFLSFGLKKAWKRIPLVVWSCLWTAIMYVIGAIKLPVLVNRIGDFSPGAHEWFILFAGAIGSAAIAHTGHGILRKRKEQ